MGTCKLPTLMLILDSFEKIQEFVTDHEDTIPTFQSARLKKLLTVGCASFNFPELDAELHQMREAFDHDAARDGASF